MKLHYVNVAVLLIFSLTCCSLAMKCNENCGDNDAYNGSAGMIGVNLLWMFILGFYAVGWFERFFGFCYFLSILITIISASFALQCLTSCDKISDNLKTAIQGVAGFTVPWAVIAGGVGFYYYMVSSDGIADKGLVSKYGSNVLQKIKSLLPSKESIKKIDESVKNRLNDMKPPS